MTQKKKAAPPAQAGTLGRTAPTTAAQNSRSRARRQWLKAAITMLAVRGLLPVTWAEYLICKWGLAHD